MQSFWAKIEFLKTLNSSLKNIAICAAQRLRLWAMMKISLWDQSSDIRRYVINVSIELNGVYWFIEFIPSNDIATTIIFENVQNKNFAPRAIFLAIAGDENHFFANISQDKVVGA